MSRYQVPAVDPSHEAWVGWDNPLQTFFAQVLTPALMQEDGKEVLLWLGDTPGAFPSVWPLMRQVQHLLHLPFETCLDLLDDQADAAPPTPLQQRVLAFLAPEVSHA